MKFDHFSGHSININWVNIVDGKYFDNKVILLDPISLNIT